MKTKKPKRGFADGYKTYNVREEGYGNFRAWRGDFNERMSGEEAHIILDAQKLTPWEILEVAHGASQDDIKKAYREKMKQWHPDLNPGNIERATEMCKKINAAYSILSPR